jgi:hypothetical protein
MARLRRSWAAVALIVAAVTVGACTTSVPGQLIRASSQPPGGSTSPKQPIAARDLLLQDGDPAPFGPATAIPVGGNYFTSAIPPECSAALLFKGSPLRPAHSSDFAESAYNAGGQALYAESIDVYDNAVSTRDVVSDGFRAVSDCRAEAFGVSPLGKFSPMRLSYFATPADGVLMDHDPSGLDL